MSPTDDLVGIDFLRDGRSRAGIDCLGLVQAGLERLGIPWPDGWPKNAVEWERGDMIPRVAPEGWSLIPPDSRLQRADLLVTGGLGNQHVAMALGAGLVLTTSERTGSVIAREHTYRGRILWLFRRRSA